MQDGPFTLSPGHYVIAMTLEASDGTELSSNSWNFEVIE